MSLSGLRKQFNKANQYLSETMGAAEPTKLDDIFNEMEKNIDTTYSLITDLVAGTNEYLQPNPAIGDAMMDVVVGGGGGGDELALLLGGTDLKRVLDAINAAVSPRFANSLTVVTKKLLAVKKATGARLVNVNTMARLLRIPRRRLYDVMAVLEGVGLAHKLDLNRFRLTFAYETELMLNDCRCMKAHEALIDEAIGWLRAHLDETVLNPINTLYSYVSIGELERQNAKIGMRLTAGVELEIADPQPSGVFQLKARNCDSEVFLMDSGRLIELQKL
ncbi:unnamed protein product [Caenorhabditis bovis]|uniref:E2F/DP family winged-helix DNA-binding domain-containing protein n=1 Tax=Caenorhabditis bovis TaxID=2654633 RepID=A0A8S1F1C9_9PELO|nr:unnamed protein product [Caenorhabditis bovis]